MTLLSPLPFLGPGGFCPTLVVFGLASPPMHTPYFSWDPWGVKGARKIFLHHFKTRGPLRLADPS